MKRLITALIVLFAASALFAGGQSDSQSDGPEGLSIISTTSIIHDVVGRIAGDRADVEVLMDYGQNPHSFEPAPRQMARIEKADLVFVNGFDLEEGLMRSIESLDTRRIVDLSRGIDPDGGEDHEGEDREVEQHEGEHHEGERHEAEHHEAEHHEGELHHHAGADPHLWMSPLNVMIWTDTIAHALGEEDPANREYYLQNAQAYKSELQNLDRKIRDALADLPEEKRVLVTGHNAFGYFARDYDLRVVGTIIPGFSTSAEPSVREMAELLDTLKREKVKALFVGASSGDAVRKLAESLERESDGQARLVEFLNGSLRKKGERGDSYISFMEYNLDQIIYGLEL